MSTRGKDSQIDYIEFNVADIAKSKAFYGDAFGWKFIDYGPDYAEFSDGRLSGGFSVGDPVRPGGPLIIFHADDLVQAQSKVKSAGGSISRDIFSFPGGQRFHFTDPDGYELAVWCAAAAAEE